MNSKSKKKHSRRRHRRGRRQTRTKRQTKGGVGKLSLFVRPSSFYENVEKYGQGQMNESQILSFLKENNLSPFDVVNHKYPDADMHSKFLNIDDYLVRIRNGLTGKICNSNDECKLKEFSIFYDENGEEKKDSEETKGEEKKVT